MKTSSYRRRAEQVALWGLALLSSAQAQQVTQSLSIVDRASGYNREMSSMIIWALVFAVIIFIGVSGALFYTVFKFREDRNTAEPQQFHGNNTLEVALVGVPILIVMVLSILTVRTMAHVNPAAKADYPVNAVAAQFYWNFEYPNEKVDANAGTGLVANGNEMIVPASDQTNGRIGITVTSRDVIHAFWAPNLGGQRDAIPSVKKTWQVDTNRPGVYQGNCNVLCGASHANMRFKVIALPPSDFSAVMNAMKAYKAPIPAPGSHEEAGYNIFMSGKGGSVPCAACHRVQGTTANGQTGPDLSFFGTRRTLGADTWEGRDVDANLHQWIKDSSAIKPGSVMPHYDGTTKGYAALSPQDIDDVAAYLKSLKLPAEGDYWAKVSAVAPSGAIPQVQGGN